MRKRSLVSFALIAVSVASVFAGCGTKGASDNKPDSKGAAGPVTWKLSHTQAPSHYSNEAAVKMADYVAEKTNGQFKIEVFHSGTLGAEQEVLEGLQMGTVGMTISAVAPFSVFVPEYNIFTIPGLFKSEKQIEEALKDENIIGKLREAAGKKNLMEVGMYQYFFRELYTKNKPVNSAKDIENQKIRIMGAPVLVDTFKALGANTTTTAWAELYTAIQLGAVEGLDHVATSIKTMKFNEHLKYAADVKLFPTPMLLVVSKPLFDKLPDEYKEVLMEGVKVAVDYSNEVSTKMNNDDIQWLKDNGIQYTSPDHDEIYKVIEPVKQKYIKQLEPWVQEIAADIEDMK